MSQGELKKCPKCGVVLLRGQANNYMQLSKAGHFRIMGTGDQIIPFYCANGGYIEFYNEKNLKK